MKGANQASKKKAKQVDRTPVLLKHREVPLSGPCPDVRCKASVWKKWHKVLGALTWEGGTHFRVFTLTQVGQASSMTWMPST